MPKRTVILHYHLFKNAGTSIDRILQTNFGDRWVTREFEGRGPQNTASIVRWIKSEPEAVAFSSHTMVGPLPVMQDTRIIPVMMLRDPIARLRSAYAFERTQGADTLGSILARHTDFEGYVRVRLAIAGDRQCRNFQTGRLASLTAGSEPERERALTSMDRIGVLGLVEHFDVALERLQSVIGGTFPAFKVETVHANRSKPDPEPLDPALEALLREANAVDYAIIDAFRKRNGLRAA